MYNEKNHKNISEKTMSRQPTLKQLKYLLAVAYAGHFGQAAKACFVSQSTPECGYR